MSINVTTNIHNTNTTITHDTGGNLVQMLEGLTLAEVRELNSELAEIIENHDRPTLPGIAKPKRRQLGNRE